METCPDCNEEHENPFEGLTDEEVNELGEPLLFPVISIPHVGAVSAAGNDEAVVFLKFYGTNGDGEKFSHQYMFDPVAALRVAAHLLASATQIVDDPEGVVTSVGGKLRVPEKEASTGLYL